MNRAMSEIPRTHFFHKRRYLVQKRRSLERQQVAQASFSSADRLDVALPESRNGEREMSTFAAALHQDVRSHSSWNEVSLKIKGEIDLVCQSTLLSGISFSYYHS
jgi:hypothetical protein